MFLKGGATMKKIITIFALIAMLCMAMAIPMTTSAYVEGGIPPDVMDREDSKDHGPDGMYFEEIGFNVAGDFWYYWRDNGLDLGHEGISFQESLALFGYPITRAFEEKFEDGATRWVQYFERARFEIHEENRDTEFYVLLGHFGKEVLEMRMGKDEGHKSSPPAQTPDHKPAPPTPEPSPSGENNCVVVHEYQLRDLTEISADIEFIHVQFWWEGVPERETLFPPGRYTIPKEWNEGKLRGMVWEISGQNCTAEVALRNHLKPSMNRRVTGGVNHAGYLHWTWLVDQGIVSVAWQPNLVPTIPNILP